MFCPNCGTPASGKQAYCTNCGTGLALPQTALPRNALADASPVQTDAKAVARPILEYIRQSLRGPRDNAQVAVQFGVLYVLLALISSLGWPLWGAMGSLLRFIVQPRYYQGYAGREGTFAMYLCSFGVAAQVFAGPLIISVVIFLFRKVIMRVVCVWAKKLPIEMWCLVLPTLATLFFAISWASMHAANDQGFVSEAYFPACVGLLTFAATKFDGSIQSRFREIFAKRDLVPRPLRWLLIVIVPFLLSFVITFQRFVSEPEKKEQFVVLVSMIVGYWALIPSLAVWASIHPWRAPARRLMHALLGRCETNSQTFC